MPWRTSTASSSSTSDERSCQCKMHKICCPQCATLELYIGVARALQSLEPAPCHTCCSSMRCEAYASQPIEVYLKQGSIKDRRGTTCNKGKPAIEAWPGGVSIAVAPRWLCKKPCPGARAQRSAALPKAECFLCPPRSVRSIEYPSFPSLQYSLSLNLPPTKMSLLSLFWPPEQAGYLLKQSHKNSGWQRRFFVLKVGTQCGAMGGPVAYPRAKRARPRGLR